jgi:hypothetical protein
MSNAAAEPLETAAETIIIPPLADNLKTYQVQRSLQDSVHDNPSCLNHSIIQELYKGLNSIGNEDQFITEYSEKEGYIENINDRKNAGFKGIFTPKMECLVNDVPFSFEVENKNLTFVYDQGLHPVNYFKGTINGMFISDAVDTAPKLTNSSQKPVIFTTTEKNIKVPGSYIGFKEDIVKSVVFSDFRKTERDGDNIFQCKVVIEANLGGDFRWYDLATNFNETDNKLTGYNSLAGVLEKASFKESNSRDAGFFIGNKKAAEILEKQESEVKPILALCLVVAKILGDFSSALSASPTLIKKYADNGVQKFIHVSGDRLCSFEALRQGANIIKTFPRNEAGVIPFNYTPGTLDNLEINYVDRVDKIQKEILKRFDDLLKDVGDFNIDKYKVDGESIESENEDQLNKLKEYVESLKPKIIEGKAAVKAHLETISGDPKAQYETLLRQKVSLMPQSSTISGITRTEKRKSLNMMFHLYKLPEKPSVSFYPKVHVYNIKNGKSGGKRKFHQKRIRRTPRKSRGGMDTTEYTPPNTPLFKKQRTQSPIPSDSEPSTLPINNSGMVTPDYSSSGTVSESNSGTSSRKMSDSSSVVTTLFPTTTFDPTIEMNFPEDYIAKLTPEKKALYKFENILNEIKKKIIEFAVSNKPFDQYNSDPVNDPIKKLIDDPDTEKLIDLVKKNTVDGEPDYDEAFMWEIEQALEEKKREQEELVKDDGFITKFLSIEIVDKPGPTTAGRKRKRKTYRRIRLF